MVRIATPFARSAPGVGIDRAQANTAMRSSATFAGTIAAAFVLVSAALSLYLAQVSSITASGYQLDQLDAERKEWVSRNEQLELEIAKQHSLVWSETEAVQRLGLTRAEWPVYVTVDRSMIQCGPTSACDESGSAPAADSTPTPPRAPPAAAKPASLLDQIQSWIASLRGSGA